MSKCGYLYLIQHGNVPWYKVGSTKNRPVARMKELQVGNPVELSICEIVWCRDRVETEYQAHRMLSKYRIRGEWFNLDPEMLEQLIKRMFWVDEAVHECDSPEDVERCEKQGIKAKLNTYSLEWEST